MPPRRQAECNRTDGDRDRAEQPGRQRHRAEGDARGPDAEPVAEPTEPPASERQRQAARRERRQRHPLRPHRRQSRPQPSRRDRVRPYPGSALSVRPHRHGRRAQVLVPRLAQLLHHRAERKLVLPPSPSKRLFNHARPSDVTQGYVADWTIAQLREPARKILFHLGQHASPAPQWRGKRACQRTSPCRSTRRDPASAAQACCIFSAGTLETDWRGQRRSERIGQIAVTLDPHARTIDATN